MSPLSAAQRGLWYIQAAEPSSSTYNVPVTLRWNGPIDLDALRTALTTLVTRHEALRTRFPLVGGEPVQQIAEPAPLPVTVVDASSLTDADVLEQAATQAARPFALDRDAPLRCVVWRGLPEDVGDLVLLCFHHIVVDAWSLRVIFDDLATGYAAALTGSAVELPDPGMSFADYAVWESAREESALLARRVHQLADVEPTLRLGAFEPQLSDPVESGHVTRFDFPSGFGERFQTRAAELRVTPLVLLLAAFEEVVRRWSARSSFLLGTSMIYRPLPELERTVGYFLNTVPIRCDVRPERTFAEQCLAARAEFADAMRAQAIPFDRLVQETGVHRDERPLVQVGIGLLPARSDESAAHWRLVDLIPATGAAAFDLTLLIELDAERPNALVEYDARRVPAFVADGVCADYVAMLQAALDAPDTVLARLPLAPGRLPGGRQGILFGPEEDLPTWHLDRRTTTSATLREIS